MYKKIYQLIMMLAILLAFFASAADVGNALAWSGCGSTYTVRAGDTLYGIAADCGATASALQRANPGLGSGVYAGQVLVLPGATWDNGNGYFTYVVAPGDTLKAIAARFGVSMDVLARLNGIYNYNLIYVGQRLIIPNGGYVPPAPPSGGSIYVIQPGDTLRKLAFRWGVSINDILAVNPQIINPSLIYVGQVIYIPRSSGAPAAPVYYTVQRGDTLQIIAIRFGTSVYNLQLINPQIRNPNWIFAGMIIRVK